MISRRARPAALALALALALCAAPSAAAQVAADDPAPTAAAPEPLWVPDPEPAAEPRTAADDDPLDVAAVELPAAATSAAAIADDDTRIAIAQWMARAMRDVGLPGELPVMAALVESGLRNLPYGDRDSVGFFQMRLGTWNKGAYEGYLARPELQLRWFADHALAIHSLRTTGGNISAHSYGHAVDIAAINGTPIVGHQGAGSVTAATLEKLVQLQGYLRPNQIISLMTIDGRDNTLALGDHADHIHVGFPRVPQAPDNGRPQDIAKLVAGLRDSTTR